MNIKLPILAFTIVCVFGAVIYAGPEQFSGKEMKQVAPMPPPCPNWTGFYVGALAGYKFADTDITLNLSGDWADIPSERDLLKGAGSRDLDDSGFELGGLIGYNYQVRNWVLGLEASGGYLWLDNSHTVDVSGINDYSVPTSFKTHYLITAGPRIGYAFCKWLPYLTGGVAIGDIDFRQSFFIPQAPTIGQFGSTNETQVGWMVGAGLEYALTGHWRVRGQYQYIDLGCVDFDSAYTVAPTFLGNHEACLKEHNATAAIIYGF
jgi:outer membrane immunogenic protein